MRMFANRSSKNIIGIILLEYFDKSKARDKKKKKNELKKNKTSFFSSTALRIRLIYNYATNLYFYNWKPS